jgi:hypothetical protein
LRSRIFTAAATSSGFDDERSFATFAATSSLMPAFVGSGRGHVHQRINPTTSD